MSFLAQDSQGLQTGDSGKVRTLKSCIIWHKVSVFLRRSSILRLFSPVWYFFPTHIYFSRSWLVSLDISSLKQNKTWSFHLSNSRWLNEWLPPFLCLMPIILQNHCPQFLLKSVADPSSPFQLKLPQPTHQNNGWNFLISIFRFTGNGCISKIMLSLFHWDSRTIPKMLWKIVKEII